VLFDHFRYFYIEMLRQVVPHFTRRAKKSLHPYCVAYIDEADAEIQFRHVHSIMLVNRRYMHTSETLLSLLSRHFMGVNRPKVGPCRHGLSIIPEEPWIYGNAMRPMETCMA
jgi:hypothetical protein